MKVFYLGGTYGTKPPEYVNSHRLVCIGFIGKSSLRSANKAAPLLTKVQQDESLIECHWDERSGVIYLHLCSSLDTKLLTKIVSELGNACDEDDDDDSSSDPIEVAKKKGDWLVTAGELSVETCRSFLLLLHICHVVVISSPTPLFDISYLHLFKAIDALRNELGPALPDCVRAAGVGGEWAVHGRPCCPRVLFYFHSAPRQLRDQPDRLKRLRHCLEDQIYLILRKARIITNVCSKSLFAIPKNEEFVYISNERTSGARDLSTLVRGLVARCGGAAPAAEHPCDGRLSVFLQTHVDLALGAGFDDNVGKFASSSSYFEVPSGDNWRLATSALADLILYDQSSAAWASLTDSLSTDVRFSAARCAKVFPLAQAAYTEGLPTHYSTQHHLQKVSVAVGVFDTMARGPLCGRERARLEAACDDIWRARRLCEAVSLTGNPCVKREHSDGGEDSHSSGVRYVSACSCGRTKSTREDPYSVRKANCGFYEAAALDCLACPTLHAVAFPVFQPSTSSFRAASLKSECSVREEAADDTQGSASWAGSASPAEALSPGEQSDEAPAAGAARYELVPQGAESRDKGIIRQPSTTEYLPGMLHTESPPGLLPAFPSWSLVCLGASSLYSHNLGLPEHLHPGFLPHTNYLLPWDCAVRLEQVSAWRVAQAASRGRSAKPPAPHQLTVKIFLGLEYECPRGHRFMMSSPDAVVSGGAAGKDAGAELANTDMPVYVHCPCRGKTMLAQLMRVHVVSPKAPVHITLDPKVQPVAGGPVFVPGCPAPVQLTGSAYWLLRLPYIYSGERGPLPRPGVALQPAQQGRLLAGMIGVTD